MSIYLEKEFERMKRSRIEFFPSMGPVEAWTPNLHPAIEMLYMAEGEMTVTINGDTVLPMLPGDMLLIRANTLHVCAKRTEGNVLHYALKIHPELVFSTFRDAPHSCLSLFFGEATSENTRVPAAHLPPQIRAQWERMIGMLGDARSVRATEQLGEADALFYAQLRNEAARLMLLVARHLPSQGLPDAIEPGRNTLRRIMEGIAYIEQHCTSDIAPQQVAARLCMSYSYFATQFRRVTGRTFKQYLTHVRIARAEHEILTTDDPITEIAMRNGYNSVSHFIATYRALRGQTPLEARHKRVETQMKST